VQWAITEKGKRMPVDLEPVDGGNIILRDRGAHLDPLAQYVTPDPNLKRYISHFVTCPQSGQWRKKKGGRNH